MKYENQNHHVDGDGEFIFVNKDASLKKTKNLTSKVQV